MDERQEQNSHPSLQLHSPKEMSQEQSFCSPYKKRGWEGDGLQMGKGTFLMKQPENHRVRTNPSGMTAETCHEQTALPSDQTHPLQTALSQNGWASETFLLSRQRWDGSLFACCLHLCFNIICGRKCFTAKKDLIVALFACSNI